MEVGRLFVMMGVDASALNRGLKEAEARVKGFADTAKKEFKDLGDNIQRIGERMSLAITTPLAFIGRQIVNTAMDAIESENLFEVAFGDMAAAARKWSEETAKALGISAYSLRQNAGVFFTMFKSMGLTKDASLQMSESLTQLAYDMASFYNLKPEEAFEKLRSGIMGETEPLRQLGVVVDDTTVQQYALQKGIIKTGEELTQAQKVAVRYALIMERTRDAQGDLARTAESPANKIRRLGENYRDLSITIGQLLLPIITKIVDVLSKSIYLYQQLPKPLKTVTVGFILLAFVLGPVLTGFGLLLQVLPQVTASFAALGTLLARNPIVAIILAIAAAFGMYWVNAKLAQKANEDLAKQNVNGIYQNFVNTMKNAAKATTGATKEVKKFLAAFDEVYNVIEETNDASENLDEAFDKLMPENLFGGTTAQSEKEQGPTLPKSPIVPPARTQPPAPPPPAATEGVWERARQRLTQIWEELERKWDEVKNGILQPFPAPALSPAWHTRFQEAWNAIKSGWDTAKNGILVGIPAFLTGIATALMPLPARLEGTWNGVKLKAQGAWSAIKEKFREVVGGVPELARNYATQIGERLNPALTKAKTVWEGIKSAFNTVVGSIPSLAQGIANRAGNFLSTIWEKIKNVKNELTTLAAGGVLATLAGLARNLLPRGVLPAYASGGIVTQPQVALVGEKEPEAIIPLSKLDAILGAVQSGGQTVVNLNVGTLVADEPSLRELERRLMRVRIDEQRRVGLGGA